ncbi:hypothetical protein CGZ80_16260 [Rhodopirellula sp. MGV]|nr:hypothetical protein CGZ80_16260 [Rhodopirellula sp. MGV]PNY38026.1 hypothetical protein C2E31_04505 [Rhodopirellula baltica]
MLTTREHAAIVHSKLGFFIGKTLALIRNTLIGVPARGGEGQSRAGRGKQFYHPAGFTVLTLFRYRSASVLAI